MPHGIIYAGLTDLGRVREKNEDAYIIDPEAGLMVLADGLGGHQAGDVASKFVVENLSRQLAMGRAIGIDNAQGIEELLRQSLLILDEQLYDMGHARPEYDGMGATVVTGLFTDNTLLIAHLGDSRAYRLRDGALEQLTQDHNLGNNLRDNGVISSDVDDIPEYRTLCRFMGMNRPLPPDIAAFDIRESDRYLLCSDGLTNMLSDIDISNILLSETSSEETCSQLIDRANRAGGYDNITVVMADVQSTHSGNKTRYQVAQKISQTHVRDLPLEADSY